MVAAAQILAGAALTFAGLVTVYVAATLAANAIWHLSDSLQVQR